MMSPREEAGQGVGAVPVPAPGRHPRLASPQSRDGNDREERERLVAAFSKLTAESGHAPTEVDAVCLYAGLDHASFDENFDSVEQILVAAQEDFLRRLQQEVESACAGVEEWPLRVRAAVIALVGALGQAGSAARVFALEGPGTSLAAADLQFDALGRLVERLAEGRAHFPRAAGLPPITERVILGGAISLVTEHLLEESPQAISVLQDELVEVLLTPYLGAKEARRIANPPS